MISFASGTYTWVYEKDVHNMLFFKPFNYFLRSPEILLFWMQNRAKSTNLWTLPAWVHKFVDSTIEPMAIVYPNKPYFRVGICYCNFKRQIAAEIGHLVHQHVLLPLRFRPFWVQILEVSSKISSNCHHNKLCLQISWECYGNSEKSRHCGKSLKNNWRV